MTLSELLREIWIVGLEYQALPLIIKLGLLFQRATGIVQPIIVDAFKEFADSHQ